MLCKYDLGSIKFAIVKWFFCGLFCWCCVEIASGFIDIMVIIENFLVNQGCWPSLGDFPKEPAMPKDLHVLTYKAVDTVDIGNTIDTVKKTDNRSYYVYTCAFLILYWGVCVARSSSC